jgi:hypothetical protein
MYCAFISGFCIPLLSPSYRDTPFATISLIVFALIPFLSEYHCYAALGLIFTHAAFCGGDFAMLSYLDFHKNKEVVTWDDKKNKVTYFFWKPKPK